MVSATDATHTAPLVLVTRPEGQADSLIAALKAQGWRTAHQPLMALSPLEELPADVLQRVRDFDQFDHIVFISANAVRFGMDQVDNYWPELPVGIKWYAVGDSTAKLLAQRGLKPFTPGIEMTSEGLLALPELGDVGGHRVLIVKGVGGRASLRETLTGRGARVEELACYERSPPRLKQGELASRLAGWSASVTLITSGEGLQNLLGLLSEKETTNFTSTCLVVPSERVAESAREAGFNQVVVAANASDSAMLAALQRWQDGE